MSAAETHASILSLPDLVNTDAGWCGGAAEGRLASVERGPFLMRPWTFALRASAETWQRFFGEIRAAAR
jgi:hypothetical protein